MASPPGSDGGGGGGGGGGSGSDQDDYPDQIQSAPPQVTSFTLDQTSAVDPGPLSAPPVVQNTTPAVPANATTTTVAITAPPATQITTTQNAVAQAPAPSQTGSTQATAFTGASATTKASEESNSSSSPPTGDPPTGPASEKTCNNLHGRLAASDGDPSAPMMLNGSYSLRRAVVDGATPAASSMHPFNNSPSGNPRQPSVSSDKDQTTDAEAMSDRNATAFFAKANHTVKHNVFTKFPHVAAADRADQVLPACDEHYFSNVPKWANILPWEFPYGDRLTEEAFLRRQFNDEDIEAWGGAGGDGNGYRFLKNIWLHIARYNAHYKIPRMAEKWWAEDEHASLPTALDSVNMFRRQGLKPEAFFTHGEIDTYGRKLACETMLYICGQVKNYVEVLDGEQQQPTAEQEQPTGDLVESSNQSASLSVPTSSSAGHAMYRAMDSSNQKSSSITGQDHAAHAMMYHAQGPNDPRLYDSIPVQNQYVAPGSMHIDAQGVADPEHGMYQGPTTHFGSNSNITAVHLNNAHLLPPSQGIAYGSVPPSLESPSLNAPFIVDRYSQTRGHRTFSSGEHSRAGYESLDRRGGNRRGRGARRNSARGGQQHYQAPRGSRDVSSNYMQQPPVPYRGHRQSYDAHSRDMEGHGYMRGARPQLAYENVTPTASHMPPMLHDTAANHSRHQQSDFAPRVASQTNAPPRFAAPQQHTSLYDPYGDDQRYNRVTRTSIGKDCKWAKSLVVLSLGLSASISEIMRNLESAGAHIRDVQSKGTAEVPVYFIDFKSHDDARVALTAYHTGTIDKTMRLEVARSLWDPDNVNHPARGFGTHPRGALSQDVRENPTKLRDAHRPTIEYGHRPIYVSQSMMDSQPSGWSDATPQGQQTDGSTGYALNHYDQIPRAPVPQQTPTRTPQHSSAADVGSDTAKGRGAPASKKNNKKKPAKRAPKQAAIADRDVAPSATEDTVSETHAKTVLAPPIQVVDESLPSDLELSPTSFKGKKVDTTVHNQYPPLRDQRQDSTRIEDSIVVPPASNPVFSTARQIDTIDSVSKSDAVKDAIQQQPALKIDTFPSATTSIRPLGTAQAVPNSPPQNADADDANPKVRANSEPAPQKPKLMINISQQTDVPSALAVVSTGLTDGSSKASPISQSSEVTTKQESNGGSTGTVPAAKKRIISESSVAQTPADAYHTAPNTPQKDGPSHGLDNSIQDHSDTRSAEPALPKVPEGEPASKASQPKGVDAKTGKSTEKLKGPSQTESLSMFGGKKSKKPKKTKPVKGASRKPKAQKPEIQLGSSASSFPSSAQPEFNTGGTSNTETSAESSDAGTAQGGMSSSRVGSHSGDVFSTENALTRDAPQPPQKDTKVLSMSDDPKDQTTRERTPSITERSLETGIVSAGEPYNPSVASEGGDNKDVLEIGQHVSESRAVLSKSQKARQKKKVQTIRKEAAEKAKEITRLAEAEAEEARKLERANIELKARMERIREQPELIKGSRKLKFDGSTARFGAGERILNGGTRRVSQRTVTLPTTGRLPPLFDVVDYTSYLLHHAARSLPFLLDLSPSNTIDFGGVHVVTDDEGENIVLDRRMPALATPGAGWDVVLNFAEMDDSVVGIRLFRARDEFMDRWEGGDFYFQGLSVIFVPRNHEEQRYLLPSILYGT